MLGQLGPEGPKELVRAGTRLLARYGYTTGQESRAFPAHVAAMKEVAAEGGLDIDLLVYPDVLVDRELIAREVGPDYARGLRIGGAKLTIDGSGDPTAVDPETLDTLEVVETVKAGETIYAAEADPLREGRLRPTGDGRDPFAAFLRQAAVSTEAPVAPGPVWRARYARSLADAPHPAACLAGFLQMALGPALLTREGDRP